MSCNLAQNILKGLFVSFLFLSQAYVQGECCDQSQLYYSPWNDSACCYRFWGSAEYLYWKIKDSPEPVPLVVTAPAIKNKTPILGEPGTRVVLGGKNIAIIGVQAADLHLAAGLIMTVVSALK